MKKKPTLIAADLFCGAGGFSTALLEACDEANIHVDLTVVNHWDIAIATHSRNHPTVNHLQADLGGINPRNAIPGGHLDLLVASPECTHHSKARGGKPMNDQSRATAFCILRWAEALDIEHIIVENVEEFRQWGPLYPDDHPDEQKRNRPIPEKRGQLFNHFIKGLKILGYKVDHCVLNSAYFGAATARKRLFIQARKGRKRVLWPMPSHAPEASLFGDTKPFRSAREIIDWTLDGTSIYDRKRPLSPNTMRRIEAGLRKFSGLPFIVPQFASQDARSVERPLNTITTQSRGVGLCQPFLVVLRNGANGRSLDRPLPTICAEGNHLAIAEPFIVPFYSENSTQQTRVHSLDEPMPTIPCQSRHGLVEPFLVKYYGGHDVAPVDEPLGTITANYEHFGLCQPFLVKYHGSHAGRSDGDNRVCSIDEPIATLDTQPRYGLAQPYLVSFKGQDEAKSLQVPLGTLTTKDRFGLVEPFLIPVTHSKDGARSHDVAKPLPTITTAKRGEFALIEPFLVEYYGNSDVADVNEPLPTVTTRDRFALVDPALIEEAQIDKGEIVARLDIRFRMLQPHELAAAMGFPDDYAFEGNREQQVRQIGNAVECCVGKALCAVAVGQMVKPRKKVSAKEKFTQ